MPLPHIFRTDYSRWLASVSPPDLDAATIYAPEGEVADELMQFWNTPLDLSGNILFEGLSQLPSLLPEDITSSFLHHDATLAQLDLSSSSSSSLRGSRQAGGKVSGVESPARRDTQGASIARILPGLFIRKDAKDSRFIGEFYYKSISTLAIVSNSSIRSELYWRNGSLLYPRGSQKQPGSLGRTWTGVLD